MGKATGELPGSVDDATRRLTNAVMQTSTPARLNLGDPTDEHTVGMESSGNSACAQCHAEVPFQRQLMYLAAALVAGLVLAPGHWPRNQERLFRCSPPCAAQLP